MTDRRITLDANVLVYAVDQNGGEKHLRAMELIERSARSDCVLTLQALAEFYYITTRKKMVSPEQAAVALDDWLAIFPAATADPEALRMATHRRSSDGHLGFWDTMLLSTAHRAGCTAVLSEDMRDGTRFRGVTVLNPFIGASLPAVVDRLLES